MRILDDFLNKDLVITDLAVETPRALFEAFADFLAQKKIIEDRAGLVSELLERENKGSTGIGDGIALPHALLPGIKQSYIVVARLRKSIPFNALDGKPVKIALLLVSPIDKRDEYLTNLAQVASTFNRPGTIKKIIDARDASGMVSAMKPQYRENFFSKNSRLIYFALAVFIVFVIFTIVMPRLEIPYSEVAIARGDVKFNEALWVEKQVWSSIIFFATVIGTLLFWQYRVAIAAFGLGILLVSGTMDLHTAVEFMSIPTILFIVSMMVVVAWLTNLGFFKFIVSYIIKKIGPFPRKIFVVLMFVSVFLGGLTGEVTGILIVAALAISICTTMRLRPFPFVISLIFATNIGSALTLIGNPIGIYIAFSGGLSFEDFLRWATPLSLTSTILVTLLMLFIFRKDIPAKSDVSVQHIDPWASVLDRRKMQLGGLIFAILVIAVGFSKRLDSLFGLLPNTTLVAIPMVFTGIIIFIEEQRGKSLITEGVDWWTILFFMFLFAKAACLEYTGVTPKFAYQVADLAQAFPFPFFNSEFAMTITALIIIVVFSAVASGFVDNLPIIAALVPIVKNLRIIGLPHANILWWGLLFGGCFGGNLTMIGSSANMVALSMYEKSEGKTISFGHWLRYGLPVVLVSIIFIIALLIIQIPLAH